MYPPSILMKINTFSNIILEFQLRTQAMLPTISISKFTHCIINRNCYPQCRNSLLQSLKAISLLQKLIRFLIFSWTVRLSTTKARFLATMFYTRHSTSQETEYQVEVTILPLTTTLGSHLTI